MQSHLPRQKYLSLGFGVGFALGAVACGSATDDDNSSPSPSPAELTPTPTATPGSATPTPATTDPGTAGPYEPTAQSVAAHPLPAWYRDARFGLFIHYGPYSVPAFSPRGEYAEWYWSHISETPLEEVILHPDPMPEMIQYHQDTYGAGFEYEDFFPMLSTRDADPEALMALAYDAGMRYVVLTAKHHDGFVLYDSELTERDMVDEGSGDDVVAPLKEAAENAGLTFGLYYSLLDWGEPSYPDREDYIDAYLLPQLKELITRYEPQVLWADGNWGHSSQYWRSAELIAWYYNYMLSKEKDVVVNDRFGLPGDFATVEYATLSDAASRMTEVTQGIGESFGYNQNEKLEDLSSVETLILNLIDVVCRGGNYLLNVGPDQHFGIPEAQWEILEGLAAWMKVNGEGIHGTRAWVNPTDGAARFTLRDVDDTHAILYAFVPAEQGDLLLPSLRTGTIDITGVKVLGSTSAVSYKQSVSGLSITRPSVSGTAALAYAISFSRSALEYGPLTVAASGVMRNTPVGVNLTVTNRSATTVNETLELYANDSVVSVADVQVEAGATSRVGFEFVGYSAGHFDLRVKNRTTEVLVEPIWNDKNKDGLRDVGEPTFASLRDALESVEPGDELRLDAGTYRSDVNLWPVSIEAAVRVIGQAGAILDGGGAPSLISVAASGVSVESLQMKGVGADSTGLTVAVNVEAVNGTSLLNNRIVGGVRFSGGRTHLVEGNSLQGGGISAQNTSLLTIRSNLVVDNFWGTGIDLRASSGPLIQDNRLNGNLTGIVISEATNAQVLANTIDSRWWGIRLQEASACTVNDNQVSETMRGFDLLESSQNTLNFNRCTDCDTGMLFQEKSNNNTLTGNTLEQGRVGIFLWNTGTQLIQGNNILDTESYVLFKNDTPVQEADGNYWGGDPSAQLGGDVSVESWSNGPY
ncbi:MAG: alpha-L-fucosidase [Myxococcota bacterium]